MQTHHDNEEKHATNDFSSRTQKQRRDAKQCADAGRDGNHLSWREAFAQETMVQVLVHGIAFPGCFAAAQSADDDEEQVDQRDTEDEECGRDFATGVDREDPDHQTEEHRAAVAHEDAGRGEVEEENAEHDSGDHEREQGEGWLVHTVAHRKRADRQKCDHGERADLAGNAIEPVERVDGEQEPEDGKCRTEAKKPAMGEYNAAAAREDSGQGIGDGRDTDTDVKNQTSELRHQN